MGGGHVVLCTRLFARAMSACAPSLFSVSASPRYVQEPLPVPTSLTDQPWPLTPIPCIPFVLVGLQIIVGERVEFLSEVAR